MTNTNRRITSTKKMAPPWHDDRWRPEHANDAVAEWYSSVREWVCVNPADPAYEPAYRPLQAAAADRLRGESHRCWVVASAFMDVSAARPMSRLHRALMREAGADELRPLIEEAKLVVDDISLLVAVDAKAAVPPEPESGDQPAHAAKVERRHAWMREQQAADPQWCLQGPRQIAWLSTQAGHQIKDDQARRDLRELFPEAMRQQ